MLIISRKPFRDAAKQFPNARRAIEDCYRVLKNGTFTTPDELRQLFPSLAKYRDRWWIIDINGSDLRLIALIEFKHNRLYVRDIVSSGQLPFHNKDKTVQAIATMDDSGDVPDLNQLVDAMPEPEDLLESVDDAPVIRQINAILTEAIRKNASDVHIEPFENRLAVRYRVDGVMQKMLEPPREIAPLIISRLKVMAKIDIAECRKPADGRFKLQVAGCPLDIRVFVLPSGQGERVVIRILDPQARRLELNNLGMPKVARASLAQTLTLSHGIILVAGPAGSGKTTTLYASLRHLKKSHSSILTIEDPVEYYIDGIGQTQVNKKVELDFAKGLRAILRQDPDIVMVGEIRDTETAELAVQASLTGHLVLSTLHANTAIGAVTRLRDMGIEPFLLASSLVALVAQRLVRVLCPHCKKRASTPTHAELKILGATASQASNVYTHHGCEKCNHTGYIGRTGIYEVVEVDEQMRTMIHHGKSEQDMENYARTRHPGILDDGARLVLEGQTTLEEVLRVTREVATLSDPPVFTEAMALKVKALIEEEGNPDLMLRLFVVGDVWSGFKYGFTFDEAISEGDVKVKKEGVKFLIDSISFQYLAGAEIDYTEGLEGSQFVVRNPNAPPPSTTN